MDSLYEVILYHSAPHIKKNIPQGDSFLLKSWFKVTYTLLIAASLDTFCLVAPQR